ncbi:hypothetical protein H5410_020189 [Solanum commersonii]|uniref:Uncharacterized protein n=1 Tax=Solanum commersonii TaxID=4109 RepID=A0A9J5ZBQ5_SOLCO|nr:hypothetical protein H5410_020189 [Solanum commersonii]
MERKALALADSGIMPPGFISRQSSNSLTLLPYKKRYSVLYPHAPIHPSRNVDSGIMPVSGNKEPGVVARQSSNSLLPYKKRYSLFYPHAPIHPSRNVDNLVKPALAETLADQEAIGTAKVSVKNEVVSKQGESHSKNELPAYSGHVELSTSSASVIDKRKLVVGASEQEFNFPILSIHPSLRHKSATVLRVSLGSTLQGFNSSVLQLKSEPVEEANAGTVVRPGGTFKANLQSIELSTKEVLEEEPMKCEPFMRSDVIAPQSVGRVLQLQESSSSTCSDLSVSGGDMNKVEASVSASMNIEDHKVYKKTQDTHNLVANGEESANDGEKISMSAGTEEECYGYQVFAGHVDTESVGCVREDDIYEDCEIRELLMQSVADDLGCVREDDIYEDGEIRELLMQSIAEDPMAEGMDSGKNKSYDDYVKGCAEKAEKILHKDINLRSPLLDKEEITGDDEQRPIYNMTYSSHFRPVAAGRLLFSRSGRERYSYMEEEKFHLRRNRFQDRSFGSSRGNFMRGRGRGWGRGRYSGSDFESYGGVADYQFRHKHTAADWESENERNDYDNRLDGGAFASNRRRNPLNDTKFTAMQRSGFPRMWSRSPVRSRSWSLPLRRLTEGLNGRQDLSQQRSPVMYREDRMRRDPPSYTALRLNDMRDVDDVQEHGHPRCLSSRRSPSDQVVTTTNRPRVEILDQQQRADGVGYFDGPIHTGRFPELHSGKRRKYGERQGGPRQMRNVKEQEGGNVRPRHEEEFDGSRWKKRRF